MKKYIYAFILTVGGLTSCSSSLEVLSYEQLMPAKVSYPEEVANVAVVNTLSPLKPPTPGVITVGDFSASGKELAGRLAGSLADSRYFNEVKIADSIVSPASPERGFTSEEIQNLAADMDVDLIIAIHRADIHTRKIELTYPGMPMTWPAVRMTVQPVVSIYSPLRPKPIQVLSVTDSLDWDVAQLTSDEQLQDEAARMAAESLTRVLVPHWGVTERLIYSGGGVEMRDAAIYIKENNWESACEQWNTLYTQSKSKKVKFRAAFNLALGCEMQGNTSEAMEWIEKAKANVEANSEDEQALKFYESQLSARIKELVYLNGQMSRFENKF